MSFELNQNEIMFFSGDLKKYGWKVSDEDNHFLTSNALQKSDAERLAQNINELLTSDRGFVAYVSTKSEGRKNTHNQSRCSYVVVPRNRIPVTSTADTGDISLSRLTSSMSRLYLTM